MQQSEVLNSTTKERLANDAFVNVVRLSSQGMELLQWLAALPQDQVAYTIEGMEIIATSER
jgi:hypothetical protein